MAKQAKRVPRIDGFKVFACLVLSVVFVAALMWGAKPAAKPNLASSVVYVEVGGGHGSGVHIGNGLILTAAHVTEKGDVKIKDDQGNSQDGELLWQNEKYDIALIRVSDPSKLNAAELSCRQVGQGERVTAFGSPFSLDFLKFNGWIAGVERKVGPWATAYIVDITVGPGMSGGPLVDHKGRVIGIVVGGLVPLAMTTAVPSSIVCKMMGRS